MTTMTSGTDYYDFTYPDDYVPVRGDTINYYETNWRNAVVLNSQDGEVTFLTIDDDVITRNIDDVRISHDMRMRMLLTLDEDDAAKSREDFLDAYIKSVKERAAKEAISRGAITDDDGNVVGGKKRGRQLEGDRAKEISGLVNDVTKFIEDSPKPIIKNDILSKFKMDAGTYNLVMKRILSDHKIVKNGQKRGTNYRVAGRSYKGDN